MNFVETISRKRDRLENSSAELEALAKGAADETIPDYQLAAWLMAAYLNGLSERETADLTLAMASSGERLDLTGLPKPWIDKHSTGGVGDKTTIVLLPLLAACGLTVVKMSGRGLGITGGTIDKLGSIPGLRLNLSPEEMKDQASQIGLALTGQTPRLAPADGRLYALRDVTGTVASLPLIVSSILSKKIAGGAESVVLDVKCGSGAFMPTEPDAVALAAALTRTGTLAGLRVDASVSDMSQPLGTTVGNALEVKEAIRVLKGERGRFADLCRYYAKRALVVVGESEASAEIKVERAMTSGAALEKARLWIDAQGGDNSIFESENWQNAPVQTEVVASVAGFVGEVDARRVGEIAIRLGAGRKTKADEIDPRVGLDIRVAVGDRVEVGQLLGTIHASNESCAESAVRQFQDCVKVLERSVPARDVILVPAETV